MAQSNRTGTGRMMTYNGITDTVHGWARRIGISDVTIRRRLASGYSDERALTEPVLPQRGGRPKPIEYNGETKTLAEWAKQYGISESTVRGRLRSDLTMQQVLETPVSSGYLEDRKLVGKMQDVTLDDVINILNK